MRRFGCYVHGSFVQPPHATTHRPPHRPTHEGFVVATLRSGCDESKEIIEAALQGAHETHQQVIRGFFPLAKRLEFLRALLERLESQEEFLARTLSLEVGKPISLARAEVRRAQGVVAECLRWGPDCFLEKNIPTKDLRQHEHLHVVERRESRGPVLAVTPFNFPINLVLHKIAPALLAGSPVLLKPSPKAAATATVLADQLHAAGIPPGMFCLLHADPEITVAMAKDSRVAQVSFTGSVDVGWKLKAQLVSKPVTLELGGTAPSYLHVDANLDQAIPKSIASAFGYAGQSCISLQHLFVAESLYPKAKELLLRSLESLEWGNVNVESHLLGPVIDAATAIRMENVLQSLKASGAIVYRAPAPTVGEDDSLDAMVRPAIVEGVGPSTESACKEFFGPVVFLHSVPSVERFIDQANALPARIQASLFSNELSVVKPCIELLNYNTVLQNEATNVRIDRAAYGGLGTGGFGLEGPREAFHEFTRPKVVVR